MSSPQRGWALGAALVALTCGVALAGQEPRVDSGGPGGRGPTGLSTLALLAALNTDGQDGLTTAEIDRAPVVLASLDKNGDGVISPDELPRPVFPRRGGPGERGFRGRGPEGGGDRGDDRDAPRADDDPTAVLMSFDANHDGTLTRAEVPARFQGLFDRADTDKNGELTRDELRRLAAQTAPTTSGRAERGEGDGREGREGRGGRGGFDSLMNVIDANHDGLLSRDEIAALPAILRGLDRDGDGIVTTDEVFQTAARGRD